MTTVLQHALEGLDKRRRSDPIKQFQLCSRCSAAKFRYPEAMTLATATPDGKPSERMVCSAVDHYGFVFFTNYRSAKEQFGRQSLRGACLYCRNSIARCPCEGSVDTRRAESRDYFRLGRARVDTRLLAPRSQAISSREIWSNLRMIGGLYSIVIYWPERLCGFV